jgi:hypothetical protein
VSAPLTFYDNFANKLVGDYASGNRRTEHAIRFAVESLPGGRRRVLDIGCRIGWSSFEIARSHRQVPPFIVPASRRRCVRTFSNAAKNASSSVSGARCCSSSLLSSTACSAGVSSPTRWS